MGERGEKGGRGHSDGKNKVKFKNKILVYLCLAIYMNVCFSFSDTIADLTYISLLDNTKEKTA